MPAKMEEAFAAKLTGRLRTKPRARRGAAPGRADQNFAETSCTPQIDKSALELPGARRIRDREHVRHVMKQPCVVCGRRPSDPHHLGFVQSRALGRKVSDEFTVPLCRTHRCEVHRCGDEPAWWRQTGIDPLSTARALWLDRHPFGPNSVALDAADPAVP